ncbi:MAG: hypothetical protein ACLQBK_19135 [Candidatus Sulfotelmatobacter sp.]
MKTQKELHDFLSDDLYDALRWLFEGAVAWEAARVRPSQSGRHQKVFGMYTSLVQARSLYEFFYGQKRGQPDDARANDFTSKSKWTAPPSPLYARYMESRRPAQKRVFHLVFNRSVHSGGTGNELNKKVLEFALELRRLVQDLEQSADPQFKAEIGCALARAILEADKAAASYGIPRPI